MAIARFVLASVLALHASMNFCLQDAAAAKSVAAKSPAKATQTQKLDKAMFGAGCFWKVQHVFSKVPGVIKTTVGYAGGTTKNPTYEQVCRHDTGHAEVVLVEYDPTKVTYEQLLDVFWKNHDPTTLNRQGWDMGTNYRSAVFYLNDAQRKEALEVKTRLDNAHVFKKPIVTEITPAGTFYKAEDYHQNYYEKNGKVCY